MKLKGTDKQQTDKVKKQKQSEVEQNFIFCRN